MKKSIITKTIFNSTVAMITGMIYETKGTFEAIRYLRSLGLPFANAKRLVFDFFVYPPKPWQELPQVPQGFNPANN